MMTEPRFCEEVWKSGRACGRRAKFAVHARIGGWTIYVCSRHAKPWQLSAATEEPVAFGSPVAPYITVEGL